MIVGHGLIARELMAQGADRMNVMFYAAGVSNSRCSDAGEYERDRSRLVTSFRADRRCIYFSTCSLYGEDSPYTEHKRRLEDMVLMQGGAVLRLSNVVGPNAPGYQLIPHLSARIARGELLVLQRAARRNIVDVTDVVRIARALTDVAGVVNVAATYDNSLSEIVAALEDATGDKARCDFIEGGVAHKIPASVLLTGPDYMYHTIGKYFGHRIPVRASAP